MRATIQRLSSRKIMIGFAALLVLGLMGGLAFANNDSELPDISASVAPAPAPLMNETLPSDSSEPGLPFTVIDEESDGSDTDSNEHSTVGSQGVYEREDTDD